jgi:hypothetical protein
MEAVCWCAGLRIEQYQLPTAQVPSAPPETPREAPTDSKDADDSHRYLSRTSSSRLAELLTARNRHESSEDPPSVCRDLEHPPKLPVTKSMFGGGNRIGRRVHCRRNRLKTERLRVTGFEQGTGLRDIPDAIVLVDEYPLRIESISLIVTSAVRQSGSIGKELNFAGEPMMERVLDQLVHIVATGGLYRGESLRFGS